MIGYQRKTQAFGLGWWSRGTRVVLRQATNRTAKLLQIGLAQRGREREAHGGILT